MRYVRDITVVLFVLALILYAAVEIKINMEKDETIPVITSESEMISVPVRATEEELLAGLTATDEKDGDLTAEIVVGNKSKFIKTGTINVTYVVFDSNNNVGQLTRRVEFADYESPKFSLEEPLDFSVGQTVSVLSVLKATDAIDGDITEKIRIISSDVDNKVIGTYTIGVQVTNEYGDTQELGLPINVNESKGNRPQIALKSYLVYVDKGENFNAEENIKAVTDVYGNAIDATKVEIVNGVNADEAGVYQIEYNVADEKGNEGVCHMVVVVEEAPQEEN